MTQAVGLQSSYFLSLTLSPDSPRVPYTPPLCSSEAGSFDLSLKLIHLALDDADRATPKL